MSSEDPVSVLPEKSEENSAKIDLNRTDTEAMLEFETQIFLDVIHQDGLVVSAKGINLDKVILNILNVYCDPGNLVFVLNASEAEEKNYVTCIKDHVHCITSAVFSSDERVDLYLSGGIIFVSTRILVVDLLKKRVPIEKITGIIVLRAHKIIESCQEAFILRLYRQGNREGFVKAFSSSPQSFTMGYGHVERIMRALFVKELYIWPRFHSLINTSLKTRVPSVIEFHIPVSETVKKVQTFALELMNLIVKELKRINKTVELDEINAENCLTSKFHKILQAQLDLIWNQLSPKSRQLIAELKVLRQIVTSVFYSDSVSFYHTLSQYRNVDYAKSSNWVLYKPAELLFSHAKSLVFRRDEFNPEICPKWDTLLEILKVEIPNEIKKRKNKQCKILILCFNKKTCHQLNVLLHRGPYYYLLNNALKYQIDFKKINENFQNCELLSEDEPETKKIKTLESEQIEEEFSNSYAFKMSQTILENDDNNSIFEPFSQLENLNITQIINETSLSVPTILIQTFKDVDYTLNLERNLENINPDFIIMYNSDVSAVRQIETYAARKSGDNELKLYFLIYAGTIEEQSYLTSLRREKEAFELLIRTKSTMVVPEDQDGKSGECLYLQRDLTNASKSTRQGGKEEIPKKKFIIVDVREFRSDLPALIHKRGIEIEPLQITVGDYILTPEICVERKSISDLIGSLASGRLYQQCTQMFRYYAKPMLLIEYDHGKNLGYNRSYMVSSDANTFDMQKLVLLTLHFPKLKIIWSPSAYATAQLFEELKQNKEEPNVEFASALGGDQDLDIVESRYNSTIYDFVQKLPGITSKNIDSFLRKCTKMGDVIAMSKEDLAEVLMNSKDAELLYSILHEEHTEKDQTSVKQKGKGKQWQKSKTR